MFFCGNKLSYSPVFFLILISFLYSSDALNHLTSEVGLNNLKTQVITALQYYSNNSNTDYHCNLNLKKCQLLTKKSFKLCKTV